MKTKNLKTLALLLVVLFVSVQFSQATEKTQPVTKKAKALTTNTGPTVVIQGFPEYLSISDLDKTITIRAICSTPGVTYQWSTSGGILLSGWNTSAIKVKPGSPVTFGIYLKVTDRNGNVTIISKMSKHKR